MSDPLSDPRLPAVAPEATAALVDALPPRLRKRLDAAAAKMAARPPVRDGDTVRIAVDDDTDLQLHAPGGTVTSAEAIRCGCLLAPDCLHRAAVACAAPVAEPATEQAAEQPAAARPEEDGSPVAGTTPEQEAAATALWAAGAAALEAGVDGSGAVLQAELLRTAHTARLAGLPRPAAAALSVVNRLRAARSADPGHRLPDLVQDYRELLGTTHRLAGSADPTDLTALRGTARQTYAKDGSLRLYGLFTEPLITSSGYAGAVTWTADAQGRLYTVSDVAPGGPGRATGAADRTVRLGDTALTHRELSHAGLALSGATVSPTGRLGAGAGVRAVRAAGAAWTQEPLATLWSAPAAEQAERALESTGAGPGLLFLDVTVLGAVREAGGDCLLADCEGLAVRLAAAHDHPALAHRDNLRLLAACPGLRLRIIGRLDPAPHPRVRLLAADHPTDPGRRLDIGLDRLQRADLPATTAPDLGAVEPAADQAPLHLLRRRVEQAASAGRRVLAFPGTSARTDTHRLRRSGLATAADLLAALHRSAADRARDPFGRLLPSDAGRFARDWLAAAVYGEAVEQALCLAAWRPPAASEAVVSAGR